MIETKESGSLLEVEHLKKYFTNKHGLLHAVDDVSFKVNKGQTLGVVGESGCGKTTLGRLVMGLIRATAGSIWFDGEDITKYGRKAWKEMRKSIQIIFQDPMASLDPRYSVSSIISEPLQIFNVCKNKTELNTYVHELMATVGLDDRLTDSYPHELDGGRRQRVGIARALALSPKLIVCDEPVSALDVSIQAQVLNLLQDLQEQKDLTYIFITHDMSVVKHISNNILVMYLGCMAELCESKALFKAQLHPYTKGLISAIPIPDITIERKKTILQGELTSPINPKPGCRFVNRCSYVQERCTVEMPEFKEELPNHFVACHYCREINGLDG